MSSTTGTIKRMTDRGFGFISTPDGAEYFFHQSACTSTPFDSMREGENVTFTIGQGRKAHAPKTSSWRSPLHRTPVATQASGVPPSSAIC